VNLDDLLLYNRCVPRTPASMHYILHGAFCCSTLLSRYLDLVRGCFVLREPTILAQLGVLKFSMMSRAGESLSERREGVWEQLMNLGLALMNRTYAPDDTVVIKVNDLCNALGDVLLSSDPRSKIVFLSVDLRTFLLSCLKSEKRRNWVRMRLRNTSKIAASVPILANVDLASLSDAEAAAYIWLLNVTLCQGLRSGSNSARVMVLDGGQVAENGSDVVRAVTKFFELQLSGDDLSAIPLDCTSSRYSKDRSREYDSRVRRNDLIALEVSLGREADAGMDWVSRMGGGTLLDCQMSTAV
jgi:hypothetical protein